RNVTGVQTCALPIYPEGLRVGKLYSSGRADRRRSERESDIATKVVAIRLSSRIHNHGSGRTEILRHKEVLSECNRVEWSVPTQHLPAAPAVRAHRESELLWNAAEDVACDNRPFHDGGRPQARDEDGCHRCRVPEPSASGLCGLRNELRREDATGRQSGHPIP